MLRSKTEWRRGQVGAGQEPGLAGCSQNSVWILSNSSCARVLSKGVASDWSFQRVALAAGCRRAACVGQVKHKGVSPHLLLTSSCWPRWSWREVATCEEDRGPGRDWSWDVRERGY